MRRWSCAVLAAMLLCFAAGCSAAEESEQYQSGYEDGYRAGYTIGKEEAARELGGQASAQQTDPGVQYAEPQLTPTPFVPWPSAEPTPTMPILIDPTPTPGEEGETPTPAPNSPLMTGTVRGTRVNMRSGPGTSYGIVHEVGQPALVEIYAWEGGWYYAKIDGVLGYIHTDLVSTAAAQGAAMPENVWIQSKGTRYHAVSDCGYTNPNTATLLSLAEAVRRGYQPCTICLTQTTEAAVWLDGEGDAYHATNKCAEIERQTAAQLLLTEAKRRGIPPCESCRPPV